MSPVTRGSLAGDGVARLDCDQCSQVIAPQNHFTPAATADVIDVVREVFGFTAAPEGTGGGCAAVFGEFGDGRWFYATNSDASLPDGYDLTFAIYATPDDDDPTVVFEGGHDMVALTAALVAVKGA